MEKINIIRPMELAMSDMGIIKRLTIITSEQDQTQADFKIYNYPTRDLGIIIPKLKKMVPNKF